MALKFNIAVNDGDRTSVSYFPEGSAPLTATADHPNFDKIVDLLNSDASHIMVVKLFDRSSEVNDRFQPLSERVSARRGKIYFDNDAVDNVIADTIVTHLDSTKFDQNNVDALVNFMEKIATNPNEHSRENLFRWMQKNRFLIHSDGDLIAYKGITSGFTSVTSGQAIVNGVPHNGHIPNKPGTIVEMPRSDVAHNPSVGCSTGLHVGDWSYASTFGSICMKVKVNPRDVVSVPTDAAERKMRVCRYQVLDQITSEDRSLISLDPVKVAVAKPEKPKKESKPKVAVDWEPPEFYEDFKKADFDRTPFNELRWLATQDGWNLNVGANPTKDALVKALSDRARSRRRSWFKHHKNDEAK